MGEIGFGPVRMIRVPLDTKGWVEAEKRLTLYPRMVEMLKKLEWSVEREVGPRDEGWDEKFCPNCNGQKKDEGYTGNGMWSGRGHEPDCELKALLEELE